MRIWFLKCSSGCLDHDIEKNTKTNKQTNNFFTNIEFYIYKKKTYRIVMCVVCIQYFMITIFISALYYELFAVSNKPFCSGDRCYFRLQTAGILIINFDTFLFFQCFFLKCYIVGAYVMFNFPEMAIF